VSDSDIDSPPTSMTSQSVDEEMNIIEVGVTSSVGALTPEEQRYSSLRKCHTLATVTMNLPADDRAVQQLHHLVHVSCFYHSVHCLRNFRDEQIIDRLHGAIVAATVSATVAPTGCGDGRPVYGVYTLHDCTMYQFGIGLQ